MRDSFLIYTDQVEPLWEFPDEDCGRIFKALIAYATGRGVPEMQPAAAIAWEYIRRGLDRDGEKYDKKIAARAEAGRKGAEKRWKSDDDTMAKMANANFANSKNGKRWQTMAKMAVPVPVPVPDPVPQPVPEPVPQPVAGTQAPTAAQVTEYAQGIGYQLDGQTFVDKYSATGWMLNGAPIRDWKALVRRWKAQDEKKAPEKNTKVHNFDERGDDLDDETTRRWREKLAARRAERERTSLE